MYTYKQAIMISIGGYLHVAKFENWPKILHKQHETLRLHPDPLPHVEG